MNIVLSVMTTAEKGFFLLLVHVMTKSKSNASLYFPSMVAFSSILPLIFQDTSYLRYYAIYVNIRLKFDAPHITYVA